MQHQPMCGPPEAAPPYGSPTHDIQRQLLLELVTHATAGWRRMDRLARALGATRREIEAAVRTWSTPVWPSATATRVRASAAALRFEALWPIHV